MTEQAYRLNLIPFYDGIPDPVNVSQYDAGSRTLKFELWNGSAAFTVPSGSTVYIEGTKPDQHGFSYPASFSGSVVSAELTQQMTAVSGNVNCEIVIKKDGERLGTANFVLAVERAGLNDETTTSDSDLPDIIAEATAQMEAAQAAAAQAAAAQSSAAISETNAAASASAAAASETNAASSEAGAAASKKSAEDYATLAESWAAGGTGTRSGEDADNAEYYSRVASTAAADAKSDADRAADYAGIVVPTFQLDFTDMHLYQTNTADGIEFELNENAHLLYQFI